MKESIGVVLMNGSGAEGFLGKALSDQSQGIQLVRELSFSPRPDIGSLGADIRALLLGAPRSEDVDKDQLRTLADHIAPIPVILIGETVALEDRLEWIRAGAHGCLATNDLGQLAETIIVSNERQRYSQRQLQDSEAVYHSLVENLVQNIFRKDLKGRFTFANSNFCLSTGRPISAVIGKTDFDFFPRELAEKYQADDQRVISTGEVLEVEEAHVDADGERSSVVKVVKTPVHDAAGEIIGMQGIYWDITGQRLAQENLAASRDELSARTKDLERSNRDLEQFAYIASHDLKEPLRMVTSYVQLLEHRYKDQLGEDAIDFINFAVDGSKRMKRLIDGLLEFSRVGTRGGDLKCVPGEGILEEVLANLQILIQERGATITHDPLPEVEVDPLQFGQLCQNLIGNALKFCEDTPRIHIGVAREDQHWHFSIQDNGIGIDSEYIGKIFQIFQRLHSREDYEGTGLGLAICRKIVERHCGEIWVESQLGEGSTFHFTIAAATE